MRKLILLQGIPGSGKSTFIEKNNLESMTISSDKIRILNSGLKFKNNSLKINNSEESKNWEMINQILKNRLSNQLLTVLDATNCDVNEVYKIKQTADSFGFELLVMRFEVSKEQAILNDKARAQYKQVGEEVISRFSEKLVKFPLHKFKTINQSSWREELIESFRVDFNQYKAVFVIGDLQSCFDPLSKFWEENPYDENNLYIFVGDFFDRGIQSRQVAFELIRLSKLKNVRFLFGNHEKHLLNWIKGKEIKSGEFVNQTLPEIKDLKTELCAILPKLEDVIVGKMGNKEFIISHSGVSKWLSDEEIMECSSNEFIFSKLYKEPVESLFEANSNNTQYQIHGHRNPEQRLFDKNQRSFSVEGRVEFGGYMKVIKIEQNDISELLFKNNTIKTYNDESLIKLLSSPLIKETQLDHGIYSYNFTRKAFYDQAWNESTIKARGLFIHKDSRKIVARSYEKFFNINEREETKLSNLNFNYPVNVYLKENGFLGILSYNHVSNDLFFASKSTNSGDFVGYFKAIWEKMGLDSIKIKQYLKEANVSFVFEVIDPLNDPHIIEYQSSKIILLDVISNEINFNSYDYEHLKRVGHKFKLEVKELVKKLNNKEEMELFVNESMSKNYQYNGQYIEGFVLEDSSKFMVKIKCDYYNFWKKIRGLVESEKRQPRTSEEAEIFNFIKDNDLLDKDIISIAKKWYNR